MWHVVPCVPIVPEMCALEIKFDKSLKYTVQNSPIMPLKNTKATQHQSNSTRYTLPVFKTRNGNLRQRWYIEYRIWDADAKKKVRQIKYCPAHCKTELDRRRWARQVIEEISKLIHDGYYQLAKPVSQPPAAAAVAALAEPPATVMQALEQMVDLKFKINQYRTATTYRNVQYRVKEYLEHSGQSMLLLADLKAKHVHGLLDYYSTNRTLKNTYRNNIVQHLRALFNMMIDREIIAINPCKKIKDLPERPSRTNIAYTAEQRAMFEEHLLTENLPLYRLTRFIYQAYIRPIELCKLQVRDIQFEHNRIAMHGSITKTVHVGVDTQYIQMTPALREVIAEMKLWLYKPTDYVFSIGFKPGPKPIHRNTTTNAHNQALKTAGLYNGELTQYSWKHTGVVNAFRAGNAIEWLQEQLRHSSLEQTCVYLKSLGLMLHERTDIKAW